MNISHFPRHLGPLMDSDFMVYISIDSMNRTFFFYNFYQMKIHHLHLMILSQHGDNCHHDIHMNRLNHQYDDELSEKYSCK